MRSKIAATLVLTLIPVTNSFAAPTPKPTVTVRNSQGVKTGTVTTNQNGTSTVRNSQGVKTGSVDAPKPGSKCRDVRNSQGIKVGSVCN